MAPIVPPSAPPAAPIKKPALRPYFCMIIDMGVADNIDPKTINEMGNVAKHALVASVWPASPPIVKIIGICAPKNAWAKTNMVTLRFAMAFDVSVMVSQF